MTVITDGLQEALSQKYPFNLRQLRIIIESVPANIFFKDTEGRYQVTSHLCDMLNTGGTGTIVGKTDLDIQPDPALGKKFYEEDMEIVRTRQSMNYLQEMVFGEDTYYYQISKNPVFDDNGELMGIIGIVLDMTENIRLQNELEEFSNIDQMTGAHNRTYYEKLLQSPPNLPCPSAVIMADCNKLKYINDTYGHRSGDYLIQATINSLRQFLGDNCDLIRIGGDEFLMICPGYDEKKCNEFICQQKEHGQTIKVHDTILSTSYGYAIMDSANTSLEDAINLADKRMYEDKHSCA